ncbi:HET-domain-containing protein [Xylaria sp. FL1777]|nr:HET-domain-containing protein [Xylaria sp. FL1777]
MRLIDTKTLELKEFHHEIPPYAILSHTWGSEEVTFQEYLLAMGPDSTRHSHIKRKSGFSKIIGACKRAQNDKLAYLWCDTNCIDKSSSAELSEAINSMYAWYRDSVVCYAYLADVGCVVPGLWMELKKNRWFTRGWTLQELLAPENVLFFNTDWVLIADRQQLAQPIYEATRIHVGALRDRNTIPSYSVAQRMSWAANRQTSRQEDIAYCLLGIFGINMPLLYGEGSKAFTRLQEEIIKVSDDQSIFAWEFLGSQPRSLNGILASSPGEFASCGSIVREMSAIRWPYSTTNLGVSLQLPMIQTFVNKTVLVGLNCSIELQGYRSCKDAQAVKLPCWRFPVWIWLRSVGQSIYTRSPNQVSRTSLAGLYPDGVNCVVTKLFGITSAPRIESQKTGTYSPIHSNGTVSTGFHLIVSFGRIRPRTSTFEEAFLPGDFTVHHVPPRGSPTLSHEIIEAGNYVVLLSIAWDHQLPKIWRYAILMSLNRTTVRSMNANDWSVLFQTQHKSSTGRHSNSSPIDYIHEQIQKLSGQQTISTEKSVLPFVQMEKDLWQDHNGQAKVVVHVTFQEVTR